MQCVVQSAFSEALRHDRARRRSYSVATDRQERERESVALPIWCDLQAAASSTNAIRAKQVASVVLMSTS
eukprot:6476618-Amphidinium_carterae.1